MYYALMLPDEVPQVLSPSESLSTVYALSMEG